MPDLLPKNLEKSGEGGERNRGKGPKCGKKLEEVRGKGEEEEEERVRE